MALLELRNVAKHFGAIEALKGVDLKLEPGEVLGLMGDNGAGKSTLVKIIAGNFPPSEGEIQLDGKACNFHKPVDARAEGIEVVYQALALCDNLTAAANVFLGREAKKKVGPLRILDYQAMYARAAELFAELKSETRPRDLGGDGPFRADAVSADARQPGVLGHGRGRADLSRDRLGDPDLRDARQLLQHHAQLRGHRHHGNGHD